MHTKVKAMIKGAAVIGLIAVAVAGCCMVKGSKCCDKKGDKVCCEAQEQKCHNTGMNTSMTVGVGTDGVHAGGAANVGHHGVEGGVDAHMK